MTSTPTKKAKLADKPGSVLTLRQATVIHLGVRLLVRSSNLPAGSASHALFARPKTKQKRQPIWSCCGWRLPRFTRFDASSQLSLLAGRTDSSLWPYSSPYILWLSPQKFQRTAVSRHPTLCSPDFPPSHTNKAREGLPQFIMAINCQIKCDGDCLASFNVILTRSKHHLGFQQSQVKAK